MTKTFKEEHPLGEHSNYLFTAILYFLSFQVSPLTLLLAEKRREVAERIRAKYPDRIPVRDA